MRASAPCGNDDDRRGHAANDIADTWNETDDAVQSKANRRARNSDEIVKKVRQQVEVGVVEDTAPDACTKPFDWPWNAA
jgi:hypothetical protein